VRLYAIAIASQYILDSYHSGSYVSEFWQPARFTYTTGIDYDIHNPYTDAYNKQMTSNWMAKGGFGALHPDGKSTVKVL
jgi:hypothetical protein